jgi:putative membrane protein
LRTVVSRLKKPGRAELERLTAATQKAESRTSAEIVTVMANHSGAYAGQVLMVCLALMAAYALAFFLFLGSIRRLLERFLWEARDIQVLLAFFIGQAVVFGLAFGLLSLVPGLRALVVARKDKRARVRERAESAFFHHHITATRGGNGLLIYVSLLEKRVELLVDSGIVQKIQPTVWQEVVDRLLEGIRGGRFLPALEAEILRCGDILSGPFPHRRDDVNELPDRPIVE